MKAKFLAFALVLALVCVVALGADAAIVSATGTLSDSSPFTLGWSFLVNFSLTVSDLGVFDNGSDGLATSHAVGLWDSSGTLLDSVVVPSSTGGTLISGFRYAPLGSLLVLDAGSEYTIGAISNQADFFLFDATVVADPRITITGGFDSLPTVSGVLMFPTSNRPLGVGANFIFDSVPVPEPATLFLLAAGLIAGAAFRKRFHLR